MNRKKRLAKGIKSLEEQIKLHEEKREKAVKKGQIELGEYYKKEIETLKKVKDEKKKLLEI
ncbi:MAG: hypothetical protein WC584_04510 [Candidatus Pacearchaeota archaeon]